MAACCLAIPLNKPRAIVRPHLDGIIARIDRMLVPEWKVVKQIASVMAGLWQFPCSPGSARFFHGSGEKIPDSSVTGTPMEAIDSKSEFYAIQQRTAANSRISRLFSRFMGICPLTPGR
jgi:hypothetical protein